MFSLFNITIALLWLLTALSDYFGYAYVWQLKWYRWDRFKDFLSTEQGKKFIYRYTVFWRTLMALVVFFWPINSYLTIKYFIVFFFLLDLVRILNLLLKKKLARPNISIKVIIIIALSMVIEVAWLLYTRDWHVLLLALILRLVIISLAVFILQKITKIIKYIYIVRAKKKMKEYPDLLVIGITGSYGKTTTKEFLSQFLSSTKFRIIKTPKNINSHFGILKFILNTDFSNKDIFIVEIGADEVGDVELVCNVVKPKIGILTAINEQHLSLFGSIQNTQKAKYELLRSVPKDGLAITNSDNKYCREFLGELKARVVTFGLEEEYKPTCLVKDIKVTKAGIECTGVIHWNEKIIERTINVLITGVHNVMNILPCVLVGSFLGMHREEVVDAITKLRNPENSLKIYPYGSATIIDDSYNSNPDGFKAALDVLSSHSSEKKRVVITRGMIELAEKSDELHEKIAGEIAFAADELVIITRDFIEPLRKGSVGSKYNLNVIVELDNIKLLKYIQSLKNKNAVILLENRMPVTIKKELRAYL